VADGCDRYCAFCIVPIARGRPRSRLANDVVSDVIARADEGYAEIVLTAVRLGVYGRDLESSADLAGLVTACLRETTAPRLRLSSLETEDVTPAVISLWDLAGGRLCRHLHMALDSGSDAVLARMRRRYSTADYAATVARLRAAAPEIAITTDVIVGFPGETEEQFEETARFVNALALAQVHVFPYSERPGTAAARLDGRIPPRERERRCARMLGIAAECARRHRLGLVGKTRDVLFEVPAEPTGAAWRGITDDYVRVTAPGDASLRNRIVATRIVSIADDAVIGETLAR
jgi:threonylcarbamoyladenosine tRNA methylthiotransferase MtaB